MSADSTAPDRPRREQPMSLRSKIVLILASVAVSYVALDLFVLRILVTSVFEAVEERQAVRDLERATASIEGLEKDLAARARHWAEHESRPGQLATLLEEGAADLLYLVGAQGAVRWGRVVDPRNRQPARLRDFPAERLSRHNPVLGPLGEDETCAGLLDTERGPLAVCSVPLPDDDGGRLVTGRFLGPGALQELGARIQVPFQILSVSTSSIPRRERELIQAVSATDVPVIDDAEDDYLDVYGALYDLRGAPTLFLRARTGREISESAARTSRYAVLTALATALLILLVLLRLLAQIVIRPIAQLTGHVVSIGRTEDTSARVGMDREDEIGVLAQEFDRMIEKLAKSRSDVVKTARLAGMSEIATGVLHNVGNVLNSVNVSTNLLLGSARELVVEDVAGVVEVLKQHQGDLASFVAEDPRGASLLPFLSDLSERLSEQKRSLLGELQSLESGVEHMMELVVSQQSLAGRTGVFEPTDLSEQMEEALRICGLGYGGESALEIVREYEPLPPVPVEKHRLLEILVNLIQNARQALERSGGERRRITLRVAAGDEGHVRLEVADNGAGISEEDMARIFSHGFTTRADGHGFGLHVCACAATEMRGSLRAHSDGVGTGATFVLTLPRQPEQLAKVA